MNQGNQKRSNLSLRKTLDRPKKSLFEVAQGQFTAVITNYIVLLNWPQEFECIRGEPTSNSSLE